MKRFTFELGDEGDEALEQIRSATGTSSKSEVVRDALALFEVLVERAKEGQLVFVGTDRGSAVELLMPSLKRAARAASKPRDTSVSGESAA